MRKLFLLFAACTITCVVLAQTGSWTPADKQYLIDNLVRSRDRLLLETKDLNEAQWNFKETPDRWSIKEVVEHINIFEVLYQRETSMAMASGKRPELAATSKPDSVYVGFIMEEKPHVTGANNKPFTYSVPFGLGDGKGNIALFNKIRSESMEFISGASDDLRLYSLKPDRLNLHQLYIYVFGHTDRHIRQIEKIKQHPNYPR